MAEHVLHAHMMQQNIRYSFECSKYVARVLRRIKVVRIKGVRIKGVRIKGVRNKSVRIKGVRIKTVRIKGVRIKGVRIKGVRIKGVRIKGVRIKGVRIKGVRIRGVQWTPSILGAFVLKASILLICSLSAIYALQKKTNFQGFLHDFDILFFF